MAKTPLTINASTSGTATATVFTVPSGHIYRVRRIGLLNRNASNQGADIVLGGLVIRVAADQLVSGVAISLWMLTAVVAAGTLTVAASVGNDITIAVDIDDYALG